MKSKSVFVIRSKENDGIYSTHGTMGGVEDAVGYGDLKDAKKFLSYEEAQAYIDNEIPEWARKRLNIAEVSASELLFVAPELSCLLRHSEEEIPSHLLEPVKGRLLMWLR